MAWDDDKKAKAIKMYEDAKPTPETSVEIVKTIAEELGETANGVRMILSKAEVYIKKDAPTGSTASGAKAGSTRVNKADAIQALKDVISSTGSDVDDDILDKLTGKQAVYLTTVLKKAVETSEEE